MPPEVWREALVAIGAELSIDLAPVQLDVLLGYVELLQRWNSTYNLTAVRDPVEMLTQHIADCLAVVAPMRRQLGAGVAIRLLDVGSGGGLPGFVLAALDPAWQVVCVDAVGKKVAFVRQAAAELALPNLSAEHARVEALKAAPFDVITSRAFASLTDFTRLTRRHLTRGGCWVAMKGKRPDDELAALPADVEVFHVEPLRVPRLSADRCLVWMRPAAPAGA